MESWRQASPGTIKAFSTFNAVGRSSWFQQASTCFFNHFEGLLGGHLGRTPVATISMISSSLSFGNGVVPVKVCSQSKTLILVRILDVNAGWTHLKHDHGEGINIGSLSAIPGWNISIRCAENLRCRPPDVDWDRLRGSLVTQDNFKAVLGNASDSIVIHQDIVLRGHQSPLISGQKDKCLLLSSSREPDCTDVGKSTRERHPITNINRRSESFTKLMAVSGVTTHQTEFIDTGVLSHIGGQVPVGHPRIYERNGRRVGTEPKETNYIWML